MARRGICECGEWITKWAIAPYAVLYTYWALLSVSRDGPGSLCALFSSIALLALAILLNPWVASRTESLKSEAARRAWEAVSTLLLLILFASVVLAIVNLH